MIMKIHLRLDFQLAQYRIYPVDPSENPVTEKYNTTVPHNVFFRKGCLLNQQPDDVFIYVTADKPLLLARISVFSLLNY